MEYKTVRRDIRIEPSVEKRIKRVIDFYSRVEPKYNFSKFLYKAILNELKRIEELIKQV